MVVELLVGAVLLLALAGIVVWLIGLPSTDDEEELAGLAAANWERIEDTLEPRERRDDR